MYSFWCVVNIALLTSRNIPPHQNSYIYFHIQPITYKYYLEQFVFVNNTISLTLGAYLLFIKNYYQTWIKETHPIKLPCFHQTTRVVVVFADVRWCPLWYDIVFAISDWNQMHAYNIRFHSRHIQSMHFMQTHERGQVNCVLP